MHPSNRLMSAALAGAAILFLAAGCGGEDSDDIEVTVSTTTAELVPYDVTTERFIRLDIPTRDKIIASILFQEDNSCPETLPENFSVDVAATAFAEPLETPIQDVVLGMCDELAAEG